MKYTSEELQKILERHKKWIDDEVDGEYADLIGADLKDADLRYVNLRYANLSGADLRGVDLCKADLGSADLRYANLSRADLRGANLSDANLSNANLRGVDLSGAKLNRSNTQYVNGQKVIAVQVDTSRNNNLISYFVDLGIWTTGCFQGSLEELKKRIEIAHGYNEFLRARYERVIDFILKEVEFDPKNDDIEIANHKGKMINGTFVKEEDLDKR